MLPCFRPSISPFTLDRDNCEKSDIPSVSPIQQLFPAVAPRLDHVRVLLLEDDRHIQNLLEEILETAGCFVRCASDGETGWTLFSEQPFDVLITDNQMPRLSGLEFIRRLRRQGRITPVVLMSGNMPSEEMDLDAILMPGTAIEKPFAGLELLTMIHGLLTSTIVDGSGSGLSVAPRTQ